MGDDFRIADSYTVSYWKQLKDKLPIDTDSTNQNWKEAFSLFQLRVESRFLNPVDEILKMGGDSGEGFTAVAIQCILVELFEAFYQGKIYKYDNPDPNKGEYNNSRWLFYDFLQNRDPFQKHFNKTNRFAQIFYEDFRCGLLHEAATKKSTKIRSVKKDEDGNSLDPNLKIFIERLNGDVVLYRTPFQKALKDYLQIYKQELMPSVERKKAFCRKMDELCQIPKD